ncbi:MAG: hypothetical protein U0325_21945 [Polyangiales bacterium]
MHEPSPETLYVDDRTDWSPQPRWPNDRRGLLLVLSVLGVFAGLLGAFSLRDARATVRPVVVRRYFTARLAAARPDPAPETAPPIAGRFAATPVE